MANNRIGFYIKKINDAFYKKMNQDLKKYNITASQMQFLLLLHDHHGSMPMREMQKILHVAQPTLAGIASRLADKKIITLSVDPNDRRSKIVSETDKLGRDLLKKRGEADQRLLGALSPNEQNELESLLKKIFHSLE